MLARIMLFPVYFFFSAGIFQQHEVAALPSIRGLSNSIPGSEKVPTPSALGANLAEAPLKELPIDQFLHFLVEEATEEQYLEAINIRYSRDYKHDAFASVLKRNSKDPSGTDRVLQQAHRLLFGVRCNLQEDCESGEVCEELTVRGMTANFCFRSGPPIDQASEPGDCASGAQGTTCPDGAVCEPTAIITKDGPKAVNRCRCKEEDGYVTKPGTYMHPDIENILAGGNLDYYGCSQVDECSGPNICPPVSEGGICRDKDSDSGFYDCFCRKPNWKVVETDPVHGATRCEDLDECEVFGNDICPEHSSCENTIGGYKCTCDSAFVQTADGLCLARETVQQSNACDPNFNNGDTCAASNQFCDSEVLRCLCIEGLIQPAGAGGACIDVNECLLGTDFRCDDKSRAECENLTPTVEEPNGYRCACLPGYEDAPNELRGTNCIPVMEEVEVTPAPVFVEDTPAPAAPTSPPRPVPVPPCQTSFAAECSAVPGEAICVDRADNGAPGCVCNLRKFHTAVGETSYSVGLETDDLECQLNECLENATICTSSDPNTVCTDNPISYNCPCADGFFLNTTSNLCENIPCGPDDSACVLVTDADFPNTQSQRVCRQVIPQLMAQASTTNPLLNACICNVDSGDWEIQELEELYCVRDTCRLDSISCPGSNQICKNAPGGPGYTCVCDFGFGEDSTSGDCVDPCDTQNCNDDQVCQSNNNSPPTAKCVDRNVCFENPCSSNPDGPFCVQNTTDVSLFECICKIDDDCAATSDKTVCFEGKCTDTCPAGTCAADDRGGLCQRDSMAAGGYVCYCDGNSDCSATTTPTLNVCSTTLGDVCVNDQCSAGTDNCDANAACIFTGDGTFDCTCNSGYNGDGTSCTPIDSCVDETDNCNVNAGCTSTGPGTFTCACNSGYEGNGVDVCNQVENKCTDGTDNCDANAACTFTGDGTFDCACNSGYNGDGTSCTEINSCADGTDDCDDNAACTPTGPGTFSCACNSGFEGDGETCTVAAVPCPCWLNGQSGLESSFGTNFDRCFSRSRDMLGSGRNPADTLIILKVDFSANKCGIARGSSTTEEDCTRDEMEACCSSMVSFCADHAATTDVSGQCSRIT